VDYRKHVEYAFFAMVTGILGFAVTQFTRVADDIRAVRVSVQELNIQMGVQIERTTTTDLILKDHEIRLRAVERFVHVQK